MAAKINGLSADQIKSLCTTAAQREVFEFAIHVALEYQEEQREPGFLEEGSEPMTLAAEMIYRLTDFLLPTRPCSLPRRARAQALPNCARRSRGFSKKNAVNRDFCTVAAGGGRA